jgi:hypothetical protein
LVIIETLSAYALYLRYAVTRNEFRPVGSATFFLLKRAVDWSHGRHKKVVESIDHGPLFDRNDVLGFSMHPGRYRVTETFDNLTHVFDLNVDEAGRRVTSYQPAKATKRLIITGDSGLFGWGLDDEETMPWLLQTRLPDYRVLNLTLNSYSTLQALLQLRELAPPLGPDDVLVLEYQLLTNEFNVADAQLLAPMKYQYGFEMQLGNAARMRTMKLPYGAVDARGAFSIRRIDVSCRDGENRADCVRPAVDKKAAQRVTEAAFDEILALHPGRVVVAFLKGPDDDPVIAHLRDRGVTVADLRSRNGYPDLDDVIRTNSHLGPFWHHQTYVLLLDALVRHHIVE